jgi:class 3 adenylate cyclase/tetratricopeptide (TPR) repeat protein
MVQNSRPSIRIDLNEFKLHLHLKTRTQVTLHFDSPSRRFYLSVIALVANEMKRLGKIKSISLQDHLDLLVLLNESIGGSAGSSDKENLLHRIYTKWRDTLPNLEEAPLFKVLGKKKDVEEGAAGKIYSFTDVEKDEWANLFEYMGSKENVRLKFAIDRIGATLDDIVTVYDESLNADAWKKFISSLKEKKAEPDKPVPGEVASIERMAFSLPDKSSIAVLPSVDMKGVIACLACGKINPLSSKFCDECGQELRKLIKTPPIDYSKPKSYTPEYLADKILTTRSALEGERKLVTVLFADVANFTSMAEKFDPEEVHQIMDGCFRVLMDEIHKYEGTVNHFTADGVMALFGAPVAHEDHAQRACYAALSIQNAMADYGEKLKKKYGIDFKIRIGLNSGPVVVGSIGDDLRMYYTAIGDTVNLASRMEATAKPGTVLVSGFTHKLVRDWFKFEPLGKAQVKGGEEPQEAYELIRPSEVKTKIEAAAVAGLTKFVGRKREMEALQEALERTQSGSGQVVGIVGEAGIGKSRLILEMRRLYPKEEYGYLEGRCLHYGGSMAYLPLLDILRSYFEMKEGEQEFLIKKKMKGKIFELDGKLETVLPPFQELLSLKVKDQAYLKLEPKQKREKIFEAIRDLFIRESQNKPLVLVFEDLHWIDKTSEEFLDYFIGWLANTPILLILLYRPEYTHRWASRSYYHNLRVDQLSIPTSAELVQSIVKEGEVVPELRDLILGKAAGNPFFIEELTHSLLENGSIQKKDHQYFLSRRPSDVQVPDTIQGIIAARIDRLDESLKRIMHVASVIGREFAFRILQAITETKEELKSHLLNLQGLELIYEKRLFPELEYIFKHALIQEVAYNSLLLKRRKEIHEKIGRAIEEIYPDRLEEFYEMLAYHYSRSDNLDKACQYLKLSGNKAMKAYSNLEAFHFYKDAIAILKQKPETEKNKKECLDVILLMAIPMRLSGYPEDSLKFLEEGEKLCKELGDKKSLAIISNFIGMFHSQTGDAALGKKYQEASFEEAEKIQDLETMAPVSFGLCNSYVWEGEFRKIVNIAPRVIDLLEKAQREHDFFGHTLNIYSALQAIYGLSLGLMGNFTKGEQLCEKALSFVHKINHLYSIGIAEYLYGFLFLFKGDGENGVKHLQSSIEYLEKSHGVMFLPQAWGGFGWGHFYLGELETALKFLEKGLKMQMDLGFSFSFFHFYLSFVHLELGNLDEAKVHAEQALNLAQTSHQKIWEGLSGIQLGRTLGKMKGSQLRKAEEQILKGMKILDELETKPVYAWGCLFLGELYANAGQKEKAIETLKKAEAMCQEMGMDYWLARTKKVLEMVRI